MGSLRSLRHQDLSPLNISLDPKEGTCQTCVFSTRNGEHDDYGCRRYPPVSPGVNSYAHYPIVLGDGWCGEFRKRTNE